MPRKKSVVTSADVAGSAVTAASSALVKVNRSTTAATMDWEFSGPDVPPRIAELENPLKQRAVETWHAAHTVQAVIDRWQQWFRDLREHGDADPVIAWRSHGILRQSLDCLCGNIEAVPREVIRLLAKHLPQMPSGQLAGKLTQWNTEANAWVEVEHPGWQSEPELWDSYHASELNSLYGAASELVRMLKLFPASVLDRGWEVAGTPNEQPHQAAGEADDKRTARIVTAIADLLEKPKRPTRKAKRPAHRPPDTDAKSDAKIADTWLQKRNSGECRAYSDLAGVLKRDVAEVKEAIDRDRKRRPDVWATNKRKARRKKVRQGA